LIAMFVLLVLFVETALPIAEATWPTTGIKSRSPIIIQIKNQIEIEFQKQKTLPQKPAFQEQYVQLLAQYL